MKTVYLDYAAATPLDSAVLAAMQPYQTDKFYNPSALYLAAKSVAHDVATARQSIAGILGAKPTEVVFTAGGTEANNLAIHGVMQQYPQANCIVSEIEHESVLAPASMYKTAVAPVRSNGIIDPQILNKLINDQTVLISVMYANNEIGTIQPLREVAALVSAVRTIRQKNSNPLPLYFHTDAAQATAYLDIHVHSLGVDLMTINGGKIYGPKQSGLLFIKTGTLLKPQILGGGQERALRSGTENIAGIMGLTAALQLVTGRKKAEVSRLKALQCQFIDGLRQHVPAATINGSLKHRLPNNVHITIPGTDNERMMMQLDEDGIMCATGSACSASSDEPSHVLSAIGLDEAAARSSLRFTMGRESSLKDINHVITKITELAAL